MRRILFVVFAFIIIFLFPKPTVVNSYTGLKEYHELSNGKWQCDEEIYPYKLEFYDETKDCTYIVLSHQKDAKYKTDELISAILSSAVPLELDEGEAIVVKVNYNE